MCSVPLPVWAAKQGLGVKIITGDRDLLQLVNDRTIVYLAGDDQNFITPEDVVEICTSGPSRWWITKPWSVTSLITSPACPAWAKRPPKTCSRNTGRWITSMPTWTRLSHAGGHKLEAGKASAYLSYKLATIRTDLPVVIDLEHARTEAFEPAKVEALFRELEFRSLIEKLKKITGARLTKRPPEPGK